MVEIGVLNVQMCKKKVWNLMEPYGTLWNLKAPDRNFESITDQTSVDCHRVPLGLRVKSAIECHRVPLSANRIRRMP